ncbi:MAG TPA: VIT domain-containing protein [Gemmatimonadaceae bacterium]|nr:VIT domain-containing protein [Gemmatimonadaceae bacterium]
MRWSLMLAAAAGLVGGRVEAQGVLVPGPGSFPRDGGPGFGITRIVRTASAVQATLSDQVLNYEVDETYANRGGGLGEVDYYFPLPPNAAFQDLRLSINGEMVSGEVLSASEARGIYEEIVRRRRDPALVEWMGQGLLHARIFPIAPGEEKRVVVRFQSVVTREGDAVRVDYKRPAPMPYSVGQAQPAYDAEGGESSFTLRYPAAAGYGEPYSPTHSLVVRSSGDMKTVGVDGAARDITILLPVARSRQPAISVLTNAPSGDRGYALITIAPPAVLPQPLPRDITFVVDVSGSMSGRKIAQARDAGKALLATLGPRDRFRLIDFDSDVRTFRDTMSDATPANIEAADRYLDGLEAHGSTNIEGALRAALGAASGAASDDGDRVQLVLFLTDGEPTVGERDPQALTKLASSMRGARHVFTFGLGADVNASLLEQVALQGHGATSFVRPEEDVERAVSVVASRLRDPVLTDVKVEADGITLSSVTPTMIPDLFAGQSIVLLGRYQGSGHATIRVSGRTAHGPSSWTHEADFPARSTDNSFIPRLWATQRIGWLTAERRAHGPSPEVDAEIKDLGERYGIPTELTSYLVREPVMVGKGMPIPAPPVAMPGATGGSAGGVARSREISFEAAKQATAMRASSSLAAADSAVDAYAAASPNSPAVRRVGNRMFERQSDAASWTDRGYKPAMRKIRIQAYSAAYFEVLNMLPELRDAFALGDHVVVAGRALAIEVTTDAGAQSSLGAADRTALRENW